jgi:hypothetical protein
MAEKERPIRTESGNKVGWEIYRTKTAADLRAKSAKRQAVLRSRQGYDFGYQTPGSVSEVEDGWRVCVP